MKESEIPTKLDQILQNLPNEKPENSVKRVKEIFLEFGFGKITQSIKKSPNRKGKFISYNLDERARVNAIHSLMSILSSQEDLPYVRFILSAYILPKDIAALANKYVDTSKPQKAEIERLAAFFRSRSKN